MGGCRIPPGEGTNPPEGAPTYDFAKISEKLHEIDKMLGGEAVGGEAPGAPPLNPPLGTSNDSDKCDFKQRFYNVVMRK